MACASSKIQKLGFEVGQVGHVGRSQRKQRVIDGQPSLFKNRRLDRLDTSRSKEELAKAEQVKDKRDEPEGPGLQPGNTQAVPATPSEEVGSECQRPPADRHAAAQTITSVVRFLTTALHTSRGSSAAAANTRSASLTV